MYEYMNGIIAATEPGYVVLDVNGIGYRLLMGNPYAYAAGQKAKIWVQHIIRDNDQALYGFETEEAKRTFNQLLTVTGIGPKSALAILANTDSNGLSQAVSGGDVNYLTKFPGIGKKTAQQIILDLKGKLALTAQPAPAVAPDVAPALADALAALVALGYQEKAVNKLADKLAESGETTTDGSLRRGLQLLS